MKPFTSGRLVLFMGLTWFTVISASAQFMQIYDNPQDIAGDLSGQTDFDPPENRSLTILWNTDRSKATDWHIYIRQGLDGMKFLGHTGVGNTDRFTWVENTPGLSNEFKKGPKFNSQYSFRVIRIDDAFGAEDVFDQGGWVGFAETGSDPVTPDAPEMPMLPEQKICVFDDLLGGSDLAPMNSSGSDIDDFTRRAIQIAWNFGGEASQVYSYHVQIKVDDEPFQYLGQTGSGDITYFRWTPNQHFMTDAKFAAGPQPGKTYQFRVFRLPFTGAPSSLTSGVLSYSITHPPIRQLPTITIPIPNLPTGVKPLEMVLAPAGTYMMGSPESDPDLVDNELPQHPVTLTQGFYIGKYEITQAQWNAVMGPLASYFPGDDRPIESLVNWYECARFCNELSRINQLTPVYDELTWQTNPQADGFRLPTEAEWEYACRAGSTTRYIGGDDPETAALPYYAWYQSNSNHATQAVGSCWPNPWGLYDMNGNVWEWCQDWYESYPIEKVTDPSGPDRGDAKVIRGGCWVSDAVDLRSAVRDSYLPEGAGNFLGFRVVRNP